MPDLTTAITSTGPESAPLPGGRSRRTANDVPILELRDDLAQKVADSARNLVDEEAETEYLTGATVVLGNPEPQYGIDPSPVIFTIGGEVLDQASKSVVGLFESAFGHAAPTWVSSSNPDLAEVIADHYHGACENRSIGDAA